MHRFAHDVKELVVRMDSPPCGAGPPTNTRRATTAASPALSGGQWDLIIIYPFQ
jgi:hypothetical protein